ncbi:MAG: hypothetical protein IJX62_03230 [Clostridia bacterium]|nr:hypothetical protein [Clostridia bacterium]
MKISKMKKTVYLFDEIGRIDDRLLTEAMQYRASTRSVGMRKMLLLVAVLSLSAALLLAGGIGLSLRLFSLYTDKGESPSTQTGNPQDPPKDTPWALDQVLQEHRQDADVQVLSSSEEYGFFDGQARLVWQYADSDLLYVSRSLTAEEVERLLEEMSGADGVRVQSGDGLPSCRIWLVCDNGEVRTPYLEASDGNVGYADFFDYRAEVIPGEGWISCVSEILN